MTRFATASDGVRIAYESVGDGPPTLLIHGFAASREQNWRGPGWYETLTAAGRRVIAMDCRGHGDSDKPHNAEAYHHDIMARDALAVLDACNLEAADLLGYSMGGFIAMHLLMAYPHCIEKLAIGGVGENYLLGTSEEDNLANPAVRALIAEALLAEDVTSVSHTTAQNFRAFADQNNKDRIALAACMRSIRYVYSASQLAGSTRPVLVVAGELDAIAGAPGPLAAAFGDGRAVMVPRRDHMTTVGDKVFKNAVVNFFAK